MRVARIGSVAVSFEPRMPFHPFIRTAYMVEAHPLEGPVNVRAVAFFLWFVVSYNANGSGRLATAKKMWEENTELQEQAKAAYEKLLAEQEDVQK